MIRRSAHLKQSCIAKMKFLVLLACMVVVAVAKDAQFEAFKTKFGKSYKSAVEEEFRYKIFLNNLKTVTDHNRLHKEGKVSFYLAINKFADLTTQEFAETYNGYRQVPKYQPKKVFTKTGAAIPDTVDWRNSGIVTPVKDQGQCGSCWSFSTTGSLEAQHCLKTGSLVSLSEQNLVDCSGDFGNLGCGGGWMDWAFDYIIFTGIDTEESYPYEARDSACRFNPANIGATVAGYTDVPSGDEASLTESCANYGPISVAIDASHNSFQLYNGGVYYEPICDPTYLDHAVLAVGYGNEGGQDYYLVKNSWGVGWGEQGYIKMSRGRNNNCGIASQASWPQV